MSPPEWNGFSVCNQRACQFLQHGSATFTHPSFGEYFLIFGDRLIARWHRAASTV
jgi:hypothetical protein